jgi:hypothetical protein
MLRRGTGGHHDFQPERESRSPLQRDRYSYSGHQCFKEHWRDCNILRAADGCVRSIIPNVPVLFNVAGANTIQFQGVSDSTGRATFSYQSFRTGTDIVQANAQITGMTAVSNQTLVTWKSAANTAPVVNAGTNQTITLPTNSATLSGTATDDGLPNGTLTTTWTQISGPVQAAIANPNQLATVVSFTQPGS